MATTGPNLADRVGKGVYLQVFGSSRQVLVNKFFDQRSCSVRKGCEGEEEEEKNGQIGVYYRCCQSTS